MTMTVDDLRNHMNQVQKTGSYLWLIMALKVAEYRKLSPDTKIHFQPFIKSDKGDNNSTEFLWVHQEIATGHTNQVRQYTEHD